MTPKRKIAIQFAALADLLFVIVFLLYLEMSTGVAQEKKKSEEKEKGVNNKITILLDNQKIRDNALINANNEVALQSQKSTILTAAINDLKGLINRQSIENMQLNGAIESYKEKIESQNKIINENEIKIQNAEAKAQGAINAANAASGTLSEIVKKLPHDYTKDNPNIADLLDKLGNKDFGNIASELIKISSMAQQIDVFEFYINSNNVLNLKSPIGKEEKISLGNVNEYEIAKNQLIQDIVNYMKKQNQLKQMVILMITHGDCGFKHRKMVIEALDNAKQLILAVSASKPTILTTVPSYIDKKP